MSTTCSGELEWQMEVNPGHKRILMLLIENKSSPPTMSLK